MPETATVSAIPEVISKAASRGRVTPNLDDYARVGAGFSWENAARGLSGLPGGGINIAHEAVDRHAAGARAGHLALRQLAMVAGSRVFVRAGRIPELYVTVLGALKNRCVASPLFSAFGPEPIHT